MDCLTTIKREDIIPDLDSVCFGWRYLPPVSTICYHPTFVFCEFSIDNLISDSNLCICNSNRFLPFLDKLTLLEHSSSPDLALPHVRTTDLSLINTHPYGD